MPPSRDDGGVARSRGWVTLTEPGLLDAPVSLRPIQVKDAPIWREARVRNASWLRPWEPTNPETPLYRSSLGPYVAMARTMRREARQGVALPWVVTYDGQFAGQLTIGSIVWGSSRSAQVGYWIDEDFAGRGIIPTALAMALDQCFFVVGLHRVEATIRPENIASRRVVEKLGFREEGLRRRCLHIDGAWHDHICYALTVEDVPNGLMPRWRSQSCQAGCARANRGGCCQCRQPFGHGCCRGRQPSVARPEPERVRDVDHRYRDPDDREPDELVTVTEAQRDPAERYAQGHRRDREGQGLLLLGWIGGARRYAQLWPRDTPDCRSRGRQLPTRQHAQLPISRRAV